MVNVSMGYTASTLRPHTKSTATEGGAPLSYSGPINADVRRQYPSRQDLIAPRLSEFDLAQRNDPPPHIL
jgi:hypothetical protein